MRVKRGSLVAVLPIIVLIAWNGVYYAKSIPTDVRVSGAWDARFEGTVEGTGTRQDDTIVMELKQEGSKVTGVLRFHGLDKDFHVSGEVTGTTFSYTSKAMLGPNCEATITAKTNVEAASDKFEGSQTQKNCEGVAVGQVTAVRR